MAAKKEELAFIAQKIRKLLDSEPKDDLFLTAVWRWVRKAKELGAFAEVHFTEFVTSFDSQREAETYNTRNHHGVTSAPINRLPLTMLEAMKWLAENDIGLSVPADLPKLGDFESHSLVIRRGFGGIESHIRYPSRDTLRPHVELLASLIEAAEQSHGKRPNGEQQPPKKVRRLNVQKVQGSERRFRVCREPVTVSAKGARILDAVVSLQEDGETINPKNVMLKADYKLTKDERRTFECDKGRLNKVLIAAVEKGLYVKDDGEFRLQKPPATRNKKAARRR